MSIMSDRWIRTATGARTIRWISPGTVVTMDYRQDRLNVGLDTQGRVVGMKGG